jgi:outer membrane protein OmpA-like peptidoglycan-associated protein
MLFGETIAWMRPNAPLFRPEPEPEPEPEPHTERQTPAAEDDPTFDVVPPATAEAVDGDGNGRRNRRKLLLIGGAALLVVIAAIAAFALAGGGSDKAAVSTANRAVTTTAASTTAPPTTIPASEGTEKQTPQGTSVTVNADVLFDVNSSALTPDASSRLVAFLTLAARDPKRRLLVEGYTDSDGDATFNQQLSEARAQSVAQALVAQGIDPARITAVGHGPDSPVAANDTPEHKALNRRVVVTLLNPGA